MKFLGLFVFLLAAACNNDAPTATGYKEQLGAAAPVTGNPAGKGTGDAAKGQTALAACTGCHKTGGIGRVLSANDAATLENGKAADNAGHTGNTAVITAIKSSGADIAAFLKGGTGGATPGGTPPAAAAGNAAAGKTLLTANCEGCHAPGGGMALDENSNVDGQLSTSATKSAMHAAPITELIDKNTNDIKAALKP